MIVLKVDVKAYYTENQVVLDKNVNIYPTNFLLDKLSITEAELDKLGKSFLGTWKIKHILTHLNFFKILEDKLKTSYIARWFPKGDVAPADEEFHLAITNTKYLVETLEQEIPSETN